tara:strand:- start:1375 stop:1743 length:369 start_codon:yes stop_codon:yes gene_type:complete
MKLNNKNIVVYAAKHYYNPTCIDGEEFFDDLKRFKYVKRLINRYHQSDNLSERLILNHLIVIFNVFGHEAGVEMLALKIPLEQWTTLKPFLVFLNAIKNDDITGIKMDKYVVSKLRDLRWAS